MFGALPDPSGPTQPPISEVTWQRLLDQSQPGPYIGENATYPPILRLFGPIRVPHPKGLTC